MGLGDQVRTQQVTLEYRLAGSVGMNLVGTRKRPLLAEGTANEAFITGVSRGLRSLMGSEVHCQVIEMR